MIFKVGGGEGFVITAREVHIRKILLLVCPESYKCIKIGYYFWNIFGYPTIITVTVNTNRISSNFNNPI